MKRLLFICMTLSLLVGVPAVAAKTTSKPLVLKVTLIQEATSRKIEPPDGNAGDIFSNTLRMFAEGETLGFKDGTPLGRIAYSWWFTGNFSCSPSATGCVGTTNVRTLTKLPGGTITAGADKVSIGIHGEIIPIQSGTGIFKGVTGTVTIAPNSTAEAVYKLVLPGS